MYSRLIAHLGSMRLAVVLIGILSVILIWATIYESTHSTQEAVSLFYGSVWFSCLLLLLGINVVCAALVRYPWSKRHRGFLLTHAGILLILIGAIIGLLLGKEGYITLKEGAGSVDAITTQREVIQISRTDRAEFLKVPLEINKLKSASVPIPIELNPIIPKDILKVSAVTRYENTEEQTLVVESERKSFSPALQISLSASRGNSANSEIEEWLVLSDPEKQVLQFGPLFIQIIGAETQKELDQILNPSSLEKIGFGNIFFDIEGEKIEIPVKESLNKEIRSTNGNIAVTLKEYFPDFRMDDNDSPVSISETPNNPAVHYYISWEKGEEKCFVYGFVFADYPELSMMKVHGADEEQIKVNYKFNRSMLDINAWDDSNIICLVAGPENQLHYIARRAGEDKKIGTLQLNEKIPLNWKMNPAITIKKYVFSAEVLSQVVPIPLDEEKGFSRPALELNLNGENLSTNLMIQWNRPFEIQVKGVPVLFLYTDEKIPLDFEIQLLKFTMPTFEGTTMPASYESLVRVTDKKSGEAVERKIWMNHPMTYGGYRISQSGYSDSIGGKTSTLQLLSDPGSFLKWWGSILIMIGILFMYFWRPFSLRNSSRRNEKKSE